jgi:hypothetical protein
MNLHNYFNKYNNFIKAFEFSSEKVSSLDIDREIEIDQLSTQDSIKNEKIETFVNCLCKIYIGHSIHQRISNEISKKTNLFILKGDYFISLGYSTVTTLGNPLIVRFYSKIAENFAKVSVSLTLIRACSIQEELTQARSVNHIKHTLIICLRNILV